MVKKTVTRNTDIWNTATLYYIQVKSIEQFKFVKLLSRQNLSKNLKLDFFYVLSGTKR